MKKTIIIIIIILAMLIATQINLLPKFYPKQYSKYVEKYAKENDIDPLLIYSIIKTESNFNEKAKSKSEAVGLMQIMLPTAQDVGKSLETQEITEESLYNPEINIKIGIKYFKNLIEKYGNYNLAIIAYNAGMGNLDKWLEQKIIDEDGKNLEDIPFNETKNYVYKILKNYEIYKEIY